MKSLKSMSDKILDALLLGFFMIKLCFAFLCYSFRHFKIRL